MFNLAMLQLFTYGICIPYALQWVGIGDSLSLICELFVLIILIQKKKSCCNNNGLCVQTVCPLIIFPFVIKLNDEKKIPLLRSIVSIKHYALP